MTQHETKTAQAQIKAIGGTKAQPSGVFEALVSVFGNVDYGADRVVPGAFAASLAEWEAKGDPLPVIWSHEWDDPTSHIGVVTEVKETADGLLVRAELDVKNNPKAAYIARLLADRRVTQFSFGYVAKEWDFVQDPDYGQVRELKVIDLFEVGPTLRGMNPNTQLLEAASALRPTKAESRIRAAYEALGEMLTSLAEGKVAAAGRTERKDVDVPAYMSRAAAKGLDYVEQGLGGDGLQEQTIADARDMANGSISVQKVALIAPWIARHRQDWEDVSENSNPDADGFPGPGAVAAYLWGVDPTDSESADRVSAWAESEVSEYEDEETAAQGKVGPNPERWVVGANLDLRTTDSEAAWDGAAAEKRIFAWAGWNDNPDPAKAKQAFLLYDRNNAEYRGAYHLPFADVVDGELVVFPSAIRAAASYLPRTNVPQSAITAARKVIDHYEREMGMGGKSDLPDANTDKVPASVEATGDIPTTIDPERFAELLVLSQD